MAGKKKTADRLKDWEDNVYAPFKAKGGEHREKFVTT